MKAIGRILACMLLAAVIAKNVIATSAANIKFSTGQKNKVVRFNITRQELVPELSPLSWSRNYLKDSRGILDSVFKNKNDQDIGRLGEARTFGLRKRMQFVLMPMLYKMGVMMTLLMVVAAISAKGLFVSILLLIIKLSSYLAKSYSGWHDSTKPIHLHIHNSSPYVSHPQPQPQLYHNWLPVSGPEDHYYY